MKHILFIILLSICSFCNSQNEQISTQTKRIINGLQKGNRYETAFLPEETKSKQLDLFNQLKVTATENELRLLTNHKNGVVRVYAFKALTERTSKGILDIIINHIGDTTVLDCYSHGFEFVHSVIDKERVAEIFVRTDLNEKDKYKLDSILIFVPNDLTYTQYMLEDFSPIPHFYNQIRKLVEDGLNKGATITLSKYKNTNDLQLIEMRMIEYSEEKYTNTAIDIEDAIEYFPDNYFKKTLVRLSEKGEWHYYSAAAVYQDTFSVEYLNSSLNQKTENSYYREQKANGVYQAIQKYKCPLYDSLLFELWEKDNFINDSLFQYLLSVNSSKCKSLAIKSLNHSEKIDNRTLIITDLLTFLIEVDKSIATTVISENIKSVSVHQFRYFAEAAIKIKNERIIEALFLRFENESNGHIYIPIVESILSFKSGQLNERLLKVIRANKNITGWGMEKVKNLIEENGLKM